MSVVSLNYEDIDPQTRFFCQTLVLATGNLALTFLYYTEKIGENRGRFVSAGSTLVFLRFSGTISGMFRINWGTRKRWIKVFQIIM